jgi:hypothetical protein
MILRASPAACVVLMVAVLAPASAWADSRSLCVYDPGGRSGDYFSMMSDYAIEAASWGVELELKPYTDEETATKDYEAGHCDGVVATGVRLQRFNRFPSTIEAMGAIPTYDLLEQMITILATSPGAAAMLTTDEHKTVGIIPVGAVYLFVRDRRVDTVAELAGKRIATMDYDKAAPTMVSHVGAIMVPADLGSIGSRFNNGDVDACYMSAAGYRPFELWRGIGTEGGIIKSPLAQATLQILVRSARFPDGFGAKSRTYLASRLPEMMRVVARFEADIESSHWIDVSAAQRQEWDEMFQNVRVMLRDDVGAYDGAMLHVLRQNRCTKDPSRAECAESRE